MRNIKRALITCLMALAVLLPTSAQAVPGCHNLGSVCDEIIHRPAQQLCRIYEICI